MNDGTLTSLFAHARPEAPAILAAGRPPLTYASQRDQASRLAVALRRRGIARADRVACLLAPGPEVATVFLAVAQAAVAAPLNPALPAAELAMSLSELRVRALLLAAGESSVARDVATAAGIEVIDVQVDPTSPAGTFTVSDWLIDTHTKQLAGLPNDERPAPDDVALVLQTSGTTARPKIVPLRHRHLAASARHIAAALGLGPADRCLNVMPLFHIHGLMACLLASLAAGGSVFCVPGFNAHRFLSDLAESDATWYSAVPTIHQMVLARAARHQDRCHRTRLRFIRSSSAALPPVVLHELEATFGVPVIEAYGMTEAAHQMASNPLPPGVRRPGTVGLAAGPDLAVMDEEGRLLPPGAVGEVVVRGVSVFDGYERRSEANAHAFVNGWFRTGDQGVLDEAGYLTLTGRLKELINRGGEKIAPREIDEVLLDHPAVRQAVAFGIPHPALGETVGAAVVLEEGAMATERELIAHVAARLVPFKVPATLRILDELPCGASGKVQRVQMATLLGFT